MIKEQYETIRKEMKNYICSAEYCTTLFDSRPRIGLVAKTNAYIYIYIYAFAFSRTKIK